MGRKRVKDLDATTPVLGLTANQLTYDKYQGSAPAGAMLKEEGAGGDRERQRQREGERLRCSRVAI